MARTSPAEFVQQVRQETRKVTWPTWKETYTTTLMVFVMVVLVSVFLSVADWLDRIGQPIGEGWAGRGVDPARIAEAARAIEQRLAHRRTAAIAHVGEGFAVEEVRIAAALIRRPLIVMDDGSVYQGFSDALFKRLFLAEA